MSITKCFCVAAVALCYLSSCDSDVNWSSGEYAVYAIDSPSNRVLGRKVKNGNYVGRVGSTVIAVGENRKWITVARRDESGTRLFYYLCKDDDDDYKNAEDVVKGPYNRSEFARHKSRLGLPELDIKF